MFEQAAERYRQPSFDFMEEQMTTVYNLIEFDAGPLGGTKAYQVVEDGVVTEWRTVDGAPLSTVVKPAEPYPFHIVTEGMEEPPASWPAAPEQVAPAPVAATATASASDDDDDDEPHKRAGARRR